MRPTPARRLLAGVVAAAACVVATPAQAARAPGIDIAIDELHDMTIAALHGSYLVDPYLAGPKTNVTNATYTYELSGLTGVSLSDDIHGSDPLEQPCTVVSPAKLTCSQASVLVGGDIDNDFMQARITAADGAPAGQTGALKVTFTGDDVRTVTKSVTVKVAEGVDLAVDSSDKTMPAKPGTAWNQLLEVTNASPNVVHGVVLQVTSPYAVAATKEFANCRYHDDAPRSCTFDQDLQPGIRYRIRLPYQVRSDAYAPATLQMGFTWLTTAAWDDYLHGPTAGSEPPTQPGSGDKLTLAPLSPAAAPTKAAAAQTKQADIDPSNNFQEVAVKVSGKRGVDLAAIGATASGPAGGTVTLPVGVHNNGPATLDSVQRGPSVTFVSIPRVMPVVAVPAGCRLGNQYLAKRGMVLYDCRTGQIFRAKTTVTWPFQVKIGKDAGAATGTVDVNPVCDLDNLCSTYFHRDTNDTNNVAKIIITAGAAGQSGSDEGGLPITGPRTALVAGVGTLIVAFGAVLLIRRRRIRFEA